MGTADARTAPGRVEGTAAGAARLVSLDVFRGLTMASMVIVNNPGDWGNVYAPLLHAEWNGWTPTDLIFPYFLFIVGVSMTLSRSTLGGWGRVFRRAATIGGLGLLLAAFPYFRLGTLRLPGVLMRIALCYLAATAVFRWTRPGGVRAGTTAPRDDRAHALRIAAVAAALALGYWAAMVLMPFPGHNPGDLTPEGNLGAFIDRALIGRQHLWRQLPWDPEGLGSTAPAIATTLLGILVGFWLRAPERGGVKAGLLAAAGVAGVAAGLAWDLVFPINKGLWTSSYVLFSGGAAALTLAACYWAIDVKGWRWWTTPFVILGVNAITLFVLSGAIAKTMGLIKVTNEAGRQVSLQGYVYTSWYAPLAAPNNASLLFAMTHLAFVLVVLWIMYRRKIFLRA
jgi:predicted acyltransferase